MFVPRCPHCKSIEFRHVGIRNLMEQILSWLFQPCRCGLCGRHFLLVRWRVQPAA